MVRSFQGSRRDVSVTPKQRATVAKHRDMARIESAKRGQHGHCECPPCQLHRAALRKLGIGTGRKRGHREIDRVMKSEARKLQAAADRLRTLRAKA